jgi:hypothetical protein
MWVGIGIGINRNRYAQGIFGPYSIRVTADGGITEAGGCVDAVSGLLLDASLLLIPSGYKGGKAYAEIPTNGNGDLTWTRASTALRTNSTSLLESMGSGVPRLSYMYGSCPALLLEPQRTNLALRSQELDSALVWFPIDATVTANNTTSPDGTTNADKVIATATTSTHLIIQQPAGSVNGTTSTISIYAKDAGLSRIQILNNAGGSGVANYNLSAGTATLLSGVSASIESVGNGWFRCIMTYTPTTTGTYNIQIRLADNSGNTTFLGNGTDGVSLWGFQVEAGAYPTSYIPTTTASATRVADSASKTGISSLIGQTEGVVFVEFIYNGNATGSSNVFNMNRNTTSSVYIIKLTNSTIEAGIAIGGVGVAKITGGTIGVGSRIKLAYAYKSGSSALYINGTQIGTSSDAFTTVTSMSEINLNDVNSFFSTQQVVFFNQFALFTTRLTNAELATLTT